MGDMVCSFRPLYLQCTVERQLCPLRDYISNTFMALMQFHCVVATPDRDTEKPGSYVTSNSMSAPSNALPRFLTLCTNSKKPRYRGSFSCEMPRCGRSQLRKRDQNPSMVFTWTSQKPSPSSSRAYSPRPWLTCLWS